MQKVCFKIGKKDNKLLYRILYIFVFYLIGSISLNIYVISSFYQGNNIILFAALGALAASSLLAVLIVISQFRKGSAELQKDPENKSDKKLESIVRQYDELAERHIALAQRLEDANKQNIELTKKLESAKTYSNEHNHEDKDAKQKYSDFNKMINDIKRDRDKTEALYIKLNDRINDTEQMHTELTDMIEEVNRERANVKAIQDEAQSFLDKAKREQSALSEQISDLSDRIKPIDYINKRLSEIIDSME